MPTPLLRSDAVGTSLLVPPPAVSTATLDAKGTVAYDRCGTGSAPFAQPCCTNYGTLGLAPWAAPCVTRWYNIQTALPTASDPCSGSVEEGRSSVVMWVPGGLWNGCATG